MKIIVVGGGQVGAYLASLLTERGHEVKIMEIKKARAELLRQSFPEGTVLCGSGTDPKTLESAGARHADVVAAVTGSDETNLVVATLAKLEYGVRRVVARVNNPKNAWLYTPVMGVDAALNQADVMAHLVAEEMSMGDMMTLLKLHGGKYSLVERLVGTASPVAGKALRDMELPRECVLVAVIRSSDLLIPRGDTVIRANDKLIAITNVEQLQKLDDMLGTEG
ncbi:MAG: NAD-binding protein [Oscillospiraceae bacterium]|jgi:trk system potassium uptake protein TrkA|nr:NAD-binding protein [Oscillospiraceae bacterium]MCI1990209.1 NAD-binding protein [Oscillospiraceae bacterium]MCI2035921.1 NAD-binding protein [Oscillospiraceae bacterium]